MPPILINANHGASGADILYVRFKLDAMPSLPQKDVAAAVNKITSSVKAKSFAQCSSDARKGHLPSMVDLSLRHLAGLGTTPNRDEANRYLGLVVESPGVSAKDDIPKATAHALLLWSLGLLPGSAAECPSTDMLQVGEHHASEAMRLRPGKQLPGNVIKFCTTFRIVHDNQLGIFGGHEDVWNAVKAWNNQLKQNDEQLKRKHEARPTRYRCAAPECTVTSDKGAALLRCSGKCDSQNKPSYCSKKCQQAHWPTHKAFCKPGAGAPPDETQPYNDEEEGEHYELVTREAAGPIVTSSFRTPEGKLYRFTGGQEALKNLKIVSTSELRGSADPRRAQPQ